MSEWFKDWFDSSEYLDVYSHRDKTDVANLLVLITQNFDFKSGSKVLDAACGNGRFSNYFAKTGFNVTSFDLSMQLLKIAQRKSTEDNLNVKYFRSDIRNVPLKGSFDLVLNMFTSFGYFTSDNENFSFIRTAYELLNEKGYFIFDYLNKDYVINNLIPKSHKTIGGKKIIEERRINNNRVEKKIIIESSSERKIFQESVLIYSKDEIIDGFNLCGFKVDKIFGDYIGSNYNSLTSERLLIFFVK